jgi:hypothetical protein
MTKTKNGRGFTAVTHPAYLPDVGEKRLVQQSSAVGDYNDAFDRPGTSFLWVGEHHHLNREEVADLAAYLNNWLTTGSL